MDLSDVSELSKCMIIKLMDAIDLKYIEHYYDGDDLHVQFGYGFYSSLSGHGTTVWFNLDHDGQLRIVVYTNDEGKDVEVSGSANINDPTFSFDDAIAFVTHSLEFKDQ